MAHDVFISYAAEDRTVANAVCAKLEAERIRCWIAPRDVLPGVSYAEALVDAISESSLMVLVFSSRSNNSPQVMREVERAASKGIPILPFRIEDVAPSKTMEFFLSTPHWLDALTPPLEKHLKELAEHLQAILATSSRERAYERPATVAPPAELPRRRQGLPKEREAVPERRRTGPLERLWGLFSQPSRAKIDRVHFSVTLPPAVNPGSHFVLDVWAHLRHERDIVIQRAKEAFGAGAHVQSKGPVLVPGGTLISVYLTIEGFTIGDPEDTIQWFGEPTNASFPVAVPDDASEGPRDGLARIYIHALQIARIPFVVLVSKALRDDTPISVGGRPLRKAFASYASADRDEVLSRIQGMQKAAPQLDVFLNVLSLRSGQYWEEELWRVIPSNDIFYLFWSRDASQSEWVEKEWRCALKTRGLDFIDPVPLVSPELVPPPRELESKHFNEWTLAFKSGERQA